MFEVGFTEIVLIFGIALLVLGPARLPKLAADLGRWAGRARAMARQLRTQLEQEVRFDTLQDDYSKPSSTAPTIHSPAPPVDAQARADPRAGCSGNARPGPGRADTRVGLARDHNGHRSRRDGPHEPGHSCDHAGCRIRASPYPEALLRPDKTMPDEPKPV